LSRYAGTVIDVLQIGENPEIQELRTQIDGALSGAGWKTVASTTVGTGAFRGVSVAVVEGSSGADIEAARELREALTRNGVPTVDAGVTKRTNWPGIAMSPDGNVANKAPVRIYVGSKP